MRRIRLPKLLAALCAALAIVPAPAGASALIGFTPADADAQRAREAAVAGHVHADTLRRHLRELTSVPHVAGTPEDRATAEYVRKRLAAYGWDARLVEIPVYLDHPREATLELVEPSRETLALRERGVPGRSSDAKAIGAFHGYGASGEVTAPVVYANYGDVDDLKRLAALGVDVRGKIVLVRYGRIFRGLKVRNAERAGASAVVIYSDPADDGYMRADPYPRGAARPDDAIQRGSVQYVSEAAGDPTTPGWASAPGARRIPPEQAAIPRIPSLPISWSEAQKILGALGGPAVPAAWQGGIPITYHVGAGPAVLHMKVVHDARVRPIWNVIATLRGRQEPDRWVVCGNHRDAWTYGAVDPNSGTIAMLEMGRAIGALAKGGWRPRRTLVLCSWDAEEYGLVGSTEWCEANQGRLAQAVAYLNVDVAVAGKEFRVNGCHALRDVLVDALQGVTVQGDTANVFAMWRGRTWSEGKTEWARRNRERRWRGEAERPFEMNVSPLGSGSDYTPFIHHLGVPSLDLRFEGLQGTYHSMYDDFDYIDTIVDSTYVRHAAITKIWSVVALRLAEAAVLPLRYSNLGQFVVDELQSIEERLDDANADVPADSARLAVSLAELRTAAERLRDRARAVEERIDAELARGGTLRTAASINASLIKVERALLGPGLPGRPWFRHEIYAPGLNTGYAPVPLSRLGQALLDRDRAALAASTAPIREALERGTAIMEQVDVAE